MADQFSFTLPAGPRAAPGGGSQSPPLATCDPRRGPGASRDDAIPIPSDSESDYVSDEICEPDELGGDDLGDGQFDVSVPPVEVSAADNNEEFGGMTGSDHSFSASFGAGVDGDAAERSTVHGPEPDNEALGAEHSPAPPFSLASPERRSASADPLRLTQGPLSGWPMPKAAICDEGGEKLSSVSPARGAGPPSLGCLHRLYSSGLEDHASRAQISYRRPYGECHKASGNGGSGEAETPTAPRTLRRRKVAVLCESRHASSTSIVNSDGENEICQQSDTRGILQTSRRHDLRDDDAYQDEDARLPPRKRRRKNSPASTQQVQKRSPTQKRRSRHGIPSPPSSQGPGKETETVKGHFAGFGQWPLKNAVFKRATVNGKATFQLEFSLAPCARHRRRDALPCRQQRKPPAERHHLAGQSPAVAAPTPPDEEEWEVQQILASRVHCEELQYQVKWVNWEDDPEWYYADGFKKSPHHLKRYHQDHPEMPGPPVRLKQWLRAYEDDAEDDDHPDDNKPVGVALIEATTGATMANDPCDGL